MKGWDKSCIYCVFFACLDGTQPNCKHKIHQTCRGDLEVYVGTSHRRRKGGRKAGMGYRRLSLEMDDGGASLQGGQASKQAL